MTSPHPFTQLERLAEQYRHIQGERSRAAEHSRTGRQHHQQLQELQTRFDELLDHWVADEAQRSAWRDFLHGRGEQPRHPDSEHPPLFVGSSGDGRLLRLEQADAATYAAYIDGSLVQRMPANPAWVNSLHDGKFDLVEEEWREVFTSSEAARQALTDYVEAGGGRPPWQHALELFEDGVIDPEFALTPRGRRATGR